MNNKSLLKNKKNFTNILQISFYFVLFWCLIGFICIPLLNTVGLSFKIKSGFGIQNYRNYFNLKNNMKVIENTLFLGISTVIVCGIVGTSLAFYMNFIKIKHRKLIHSILLSPMMVPGVILVISFIQIYGESGLVTKSIQIILGLKNVPFNFTGLGAILFIHACTQYVYFYLNVSVSLKYVDYSTIEAARGFGASKRKIFTSILIPKILPALLSSTMVTFISGSSSFSAPILLGGRYKVLSTQIMLSKANNYMSLASMQVVVLMIMGLSVMPISRYYENKFSEESSIRAVPISQQKIESPILRWVANVFVGCIIIMIVIPIAAIFFFSFVKSSSMMVDIFPREFGLDNYIKIFTKEGILKPFLNSINMSIITVLIGLGISLPAAYLITKRKNNLNRIAELIIMLPWAMPASTIAINLINTFNTKNIFMFNQVLIGTYWILPIGYIITSLPLLMRTNMIALESFNIALEHASRSLGAGIIHTFARVIAPIVLPAIISGGALIFIRTLGEHTMSALLYGIHNKPISIAMVNAMQEYDIGLSMAYGAMIIMICFVTMTLIFNINKGKYDEVI